MNKELPTTQKKKKNQQPPKPNSEYAEGLN